MRIPFGLNVTTAALAVIALSFALSPAAGVGAGTAADGCMKQWMFNGDWRVEVTSVDPLMDTDGTTQIGWKVTEAWRNGTTQLLAPGDSDALPQRLELADGTTISTSDTRMGGGSDTDLVTHEFSVAGEMTHVEDFKAAGAFNPSVKPKAVDIDFNGDLLAQSRFRPHFSTKAYDFHIKLDCTATGAAANAQGGSTEIAAQQGCLNQWLSNGVWRMRATAIGPFNNADGLRVGWAVTEQWTNVSNQAIAPYDTLVQDEQLAFASGNTVASSNTITSGNYFQKITFDTLNPGASVTDPVVFWPTPFDASQTPVKVLVMFDAAHANQSRFRPHYTTNPANFRIDLTCTK
jgi:V8-like Glu-specific endopeptidase